jgi:hypothetical protein
MSANSKREGIEIEAVFRIEAGGDRSADKAVV